MHASVMEIEGGSSPKGGTVHASVMEIEGASSHNDGNCDFCGSRSLIIRYWSRSKGRFLHPVFFKRHEWEIVSGSEKRALKKVVL